MHQFNYFGSTPGGGITANAFNEDVELLEREIETVMMRKGGTAVGGKRERLNAQNGIVNMTTQGFEHGRTQTAGAKDGKRRRHIPKFGSMSQAQNNMSMPLKGLNTVSGKAYK